MSNDVDKTAGEKAGGFVVGTTAAGATLGAMVGGPIGAAVGGIIGAVVGGATVIANEKGGKQ